MKREGTLKKVAKRLAKILIENEEKTIDDVVVEFSNKVLSKKSHEELLRILLDYAKDSEDYMSDLKDMLIEIISENLADEIEDEILLNMGEE